MRRIEASLPATGVQPALEVSVLDHVSRCTHCRRCVVECEFLKKYGDPGELAAGYDPENSFHQGLPFECSLCGLCTAVCPEGLDPSALFLEMRRETVRRGKGDYPEHKGLLAYERKGTSKRFTWYALPEGCTIVFFPGCALPGTRPDRTLDVFRFLQARDPRTGIVLDCCTKPSHDLGREDYFEAMFGELKSFLLENGIRTVLVACPNCYRVFSDYGKDFEIRTIYEFLAEDAFPILQPTNEVSVHDPCVIRFEEKPQAAVRSLLGARGIAIQSDRHSGRNTLCCGEGGSVGSIAPDLARKWTRQRTREAEGRRIVTSCAGCAHILGSHGPTSHILDVAFDPQTALSGRTKVSRAPFTYVNRLLLKRKLRKTMPAEVTRERTFNAGEEIKGGWLGKMAVLVTMALVIVAVRTSGMTEYLDQENLRNLISGYGALAPLIFMGIYTIAPVLFLPGLPLTIAAGILFGPVWGVAYTIISATMGACLAFLVSRYLARGWIEERMRSPRWRHLDEQVIKHGWKMVAFTRLIPLFPFNLLNYAFGLTKIKFSHFALATFVFMLPGCIAFIVFSSSLLDVLRGKISPTFLLGLGLMVAVSLIPFLYRRHQLRQFRKKEGMTEKQPAPAVRVVTCNPRRRLVRKGIILLGVAGLAGVAWVLGRHYFWAINAHVYTAEFHLMFMVNNLRAGNLELFTDYFRATGAGITGFSFLFLGHLIQSFWIPLTSPILPSAFVAANGLVAGALLSFGAFLLVGLLAFGLGRFFLGDLLPLLGKDPRRTRDSRSWAAILAILTALPWFPLPVAPLVAGFLRWSPKRTSWIFACGAGLRLLMLLMFPGLFI